MGQPTFAITVRVPQAAKPAMAWLTNTPLQVYSMMQKSVTIPWNVLRAVNHSSDALRSLPLLSKQEGLSAHMQRAVQYFDRVPQKWPLDFTRGCSRLLVLRNQEGKVVIFDLLDLKGELPDALTDFLASKDKIVVVWNDRAEINMMLNGTRYMAAYEGSPRAQIANMVCAQLFWGQEIIRKRWWDICDLDTQNTRFLPPKSATRSPLNSFSEYHLYRAPLIHVAYLCSGIDISDLVFSLEPIGLKFMEPLDNGGSPGLLTRLCTEVGWIMDVFWVGMVLSTHELIQRVKNNQDFNMKTITDILSRLHDCDSLFRFDNTTQQPVDNGLWTQLKPWHRDNRTEAYNSHHVGQSTLARDATFNNFWKTLWWDPRNPHWPILCTFTTVVNKKRLDFSSRPVEEPVIFTYWPSLNHWNRLAKFAVSPGVSLDKVLAHSSGLHQLKPVKGVKGEWRDPYDPSDVTFGQLRKMSEEFAIRWDRSFLASPGENRGTDRSRLQLEWLLEMGREAYGPEFTHPGDYLQASEVEGRKAAWRANPRTADQDFKRWPKHQLPPPLLINPASQKRLPWPWESGHLRQYRFDLPGFKGELIFAGDNLPERVALTSEPSILNPNDAERSRVELDELYPATMIPFALPRIHHDGVRDQLRPAAIKKMNEHWVAKWWRRIHPGPHPPFFQDLEAYYTYCAHVLTMPESVESIVAIDYVLAEGEYEGEGEDSRTRG